MDAPAISIIDDDESVRTALTGLLRSLGYRAQAYASAEDFLAADAVRTADCVITDIHMPGLSGIDLKHRLVAEGLAVPVIMITGRTDPGLGERAMESGAVCLLKKPFEADELISCLDRALAS